VIWRYAPVPRPGSDESGVNDQSIALTTQTEAQILTQQAFELMLPPEDETRVAASLDLFQRVIEIDSNFAGGYAGKSIALSFQVIFTKSESPPDDILTSIDMAETAIAKAPEFSMGYAALALAQALNGKADQALNSVKRVLGIWPHEANVIGIAAAALIISGDARPAIDLLEEALELDPNNPRTAYLNLLGIAYFVTGDYGKAENLVERNLARGGPGGPHMDVFLAATYMRLGKELNAQAALERLHRTHPDYPVKQWLSNFITSEDEVLEILNQFQLLSNL